MSEISIPKIKQAIADISTTKEFIFNTDDRGYNKKQNEQFHIADGGIELIIEALKTNDNKSLDTLILDSCGIGGSSAWKITRALTSNPKMLTWLSLKNNRIGYEGLYGLQSYLGDFNISVLRSLYLGGNCLGNDVGDSMEIILENNTTLKTLCLKDNDIGIKGIQGISTGLKHNNTLVDLSLKHNNFGNKGAQYIAESLYVNKGLSSLKLKDCNISNAGAIAIAKALKVNKHLRYLNLDTNDIKCPGLLALADSLGTNRTLHFLSLEKNECINGPVSDKFIEILSKNRVITQLFLNDTSPDMKYLYGARVINRLLKENQELVHKIYKKKEKIFADVLFLEQCDTSVLLSVDGGVGLNGFNLTETSNSIRKSTDHIKIKIILKILKELEISSKRCYEFEPNVLVRIANYLSVKDLLYFVMCLKFKYKLNITDS